jgi:ATP-dependent helicase/nuclease subunit A
MDFTQAIAELAMLRQQKMIEEMGVEPRRPDAVRLMTLHGAKGLEAPVVFLADPSPFNPPGRTYFIDRSVDPPRGYFRICRKAEGFGGDIEIARPTGWNQMQETEERFDDAEETRLLYVGATRAEKMFVVSFRMTAANKPSGTWEALSPFIEGRLPQPGALSREAPAPLPQLSEQLAASRRRRDEDRERCAPASYAVAAVTSLAHAGQDRPFHESTGRGLSWGSVIHRLLEAVMRDPDLDVRSYAVNVLAEEGREPEDLEEALRTVEAVRSSPLWSRALAARQRLVEVPFALMVPTSDLGGASGPPETLLTGALDLVFEEEEGWTIVDYKSDTITDNLEEIVAFYRPQIAHYRRYWEQLTGRPAKAGLFFTSTGQEVWI